MAIMTFLPWTIGAIFKLALGTAGIACTFLLSLAPAPTFYAVLKKKDAEGISSLPYMCGFFQGLLWAFYGLPLVTPGALLITIDDSIAAGFELLYVIIFIACSRAEAKRGAFLQFLIVLLCFGAVVAVALLGFPHPDSSSKSRQIFVGSMAASAYTLMFAAPLSLMGLAIQTRSVDFMPWWLSLLSFMTSGSWAGYGVYTKDPFLGFPAIIGALIGLGQLFLCALYGRRSEEVIETQSTTKTMSTSREKPESARMATPHQARKLSSASHYEGNVFYGGGIVSSPVMASQYAWYRSKILESSYGVPQLKKLPMPSSPMTPGVFVSTLAGFLDPPGPPPTEVRSDHSEIQQVQGERTPHDVRTPTMFSSMIEASRKQKGLWSPHKMFRSPSQLESPAPHPGRERLSVSSLETLTSGELYTPAPPKEMELPSHKSKMKKQLSEPSFQSSTSFSDWQHTKSKI